MYKHLGYVEGNFQKDLWRSGKRDEKICRNWILDKKVCISSFQIKKEWSLVGSPRGHMGLAVEECVLSSGGGGKEWVGWHIGEFHLRLGQRKSSGWEAFLLPVTGHLLWSNYSGKYAIWDSPCWSPKGKISSYFSEQTCVNYKYSKSLHEEWLFPV